MDRLDWEPGVEGKGLVDEHGNLHTWNEDEYETHNDYILNHNQEVGSPKGYFYIDPDGSVDVSHPSALYDPHGNHLMSEYICDVHPNFKPTKNGWEF